MSIREYFIVEKLIGNENEDGTRIIEIIKSLEENPLAKDCLKYNNIEKALEFIPDEFLSRKAKNVQDRYKIFI